MNDNALDPVFAADRDHGSTAPQGGAASSNVVGRPNDDETSGFHEATESVEVERESFSGEEAIKDGGSFDGLGVPVAVD